MERLALRVAGHVLVLWARSAAIPAALLLALAIYALSVGEAGLLSLVGSFATILVVGLAVPFTLHETGHAVAMRHCAGIDRVDIHASFNRISLSPHGAVSRREAIAISVAGPGVCVLLGAALLLVLPNSILPWMYISHAMFLIPPFGDGAALVAALRQVR